MDETVRARAFEPFFTTKESGKGTGLGLASVYGTVKNHNGFIDLWSAPGKGTTVVICLPLCAAPAEQDDKETLPAPIEKRSGRILVADDEQFIREMASDALSELGYTVSACADGGEAVARYRERWREFDLVIIDLSMPGLGGADCFREMKRINPQLRAVISSGHLMDGEIDALLGEGVAGFLHKPFDLAALSETVIAALSAR
jgi:CheY-like chemotaxis protein